MIKLCFDTTVPLTYIIYSFFFFIKKKRQTHTLLTYTIELFTTPVRTFLGTRQIFLLHDGCTFLWVFELINIHRYRSHAR